MLITLFLKKRWCKDNLIFLKNYKEKAMKNSQEFTKVL